MAGGDAKSWTVQEYWVKLIVQVIEPVKVIQVSRVPPCRVEGRCCGAGPTQQEYLIIGVMTYIGDRD
eukprot:12890601-Prorocentrum_lima.AAC.1